MIEAEKEFEINYIDASGMCEFSRCPAKYLFSRLMGLKLPDSDTIAVDYGTDMHRAFPHCYEDDVGCVAKAINKFKEGWDKRAHGETNEKRTSIKARESLAEFHRLHKPGVCPYTFFDFVRNIEAPTADTISENELPFTIDVGASLPLCGRIDALVRMENSGDVWALDYKTTAEISSRYFANFENAPATVGYTLAAEAITGEHVHGLIIEAVRVSKSKVENQMFHVFVNEAQVKMFIELAKYTADMILVSNTMQSWKQNPAACSPYSTFGQPGRYCEYKDLCQIGDWREMVKYFKAIEPFHPFVVKR